MQIDFGGIAKGYTSARIMDIFRACGIKSGRIIANETDVIDVYDPNLTLKGMNLIYKKQNRKSGKIKK